MKESPWFLTRNGTASGNLNIVTACKGIEDTKHNKAGYNRQTTLSLSDQYECCDECLCFNTHPLEQPASISHQTDAQKVADWLQWRERSCLSSPTDSPQHSHDNSTHSQDDNCYLCADVLHPHDQGMWKIVGKWLGAMHVKAHERYGSQNFIYRLLTRRIQ